MPVDRREQLARASTARAKRHRRVGLLLIWLGVAAWVVPFVVFVVLSMDGVELGNWPQTVVGSIFPVSVALSR
jgi:hypothetical protein